MRLSITHFIATSVLAHAAIFVAGVGTQSPALLIPSTPSSAPAFEVTLQSTTITAKPSHAVMNRRKHSKPQPMRPQQLTNTQSPEPAHEVTTPPAATATTTPYQAEFRRSEVRDRVLSRIRNNLQQYFVYPLLAQRQGWQGQVLLGFSVEADGMIRNIHVAAGSGYPILDTSAVAALSRVQQLFEASDWLRGKRLELQMPVIFQLQGG